MKLNPSEAPLYGECVLTVELEDGEVSPRADKEEEEEEEEELVEFYLLFSGSSQRHLTSTIRVSRVSLQAVCPGHNVCEQVLVVLCVARPNGAVITCSQENFTFVQNIALDTAQLLLNSTSHQETPLLTDRKECKKVDESLVLALKHLTQLHRLSPFSDAQPHIHLPRDELHTKHTQADDHENITQSHRTTEEHNTDTQLSNCITEHQQLSGPLLAAADSLNSTDSFIFQQTGVRGTLKSSANQYTACEATTRDHQQQLELFTHSDVEDGNDKLHIDPDGKVFQHHSQFGTFTLTLPSLVQWENKPGKDYILQDHVAQLKKHIQEYRDKKGKLDHCGTLTATTASTSVCYNHENPTGSVNEIAPGNNGITKPAEDIDQQETRQLDITAAVTVVSVGQSQETGGAQAAHHGRHRRNKKRTAKSSQAVTQSPGSAPEGTKGTATDSAAETKALSSSEHATCTEKDLSEIPTSPERDDQSSSRKNVALLAPSIVEKQEEEKWEVEQIILDQVSPTVKELGHTESPLSKECLLILLQDGATKRNEAMGQDQSQTDPETHSENTATPDAKRRIHSKKVQDGSKCTAENAPKWCQGGDNDLMKEEETKSQSVWYVSEQLEQDMSKEMDFSSAQLSEQCVSSRQLSPTLSQPHAAGLEPGVSHGPAAQRQEVRGPQRDEETGPDWEKSGREAVSSHSKRSSENEEEDDRRGHGDKRAKSKKTKRRKRGKRGGSERRTLSSTSSIESQNQIEIQVTDQNIPTSKDTDETGRTDSPAPSASVIEKTDKNTMHLPNQAQGETTDGTNLDFSHLESELTELSGTSDFKLLGEPFEDKNTTLHENAELVLDTAAGQSKEMHDQTTKNLDMPASQMERKELTVAKDDNILLNDDYIGKVLKDQPTELPDTHPDVNQLTSDAFLNQKTVQFVNKPSQLGHPSHNSPENGQPVGVYDPPIDGAADVPPLQTREGSTVITAQGPSGHCLASEMLGHQQTLKEKNKIELWKEEEAKIGSLQRREELETCSNNVAQVEEGPCIDTEQELVATAVAVVTVAIASAMAKLEIQQKLKETSGIDPLLKQEPDETQFNIVSDSSYFKVDHNKDQLCSESSAPPETENSEHTQNELNIDFAQQSLTDSNAKGNQEPDVSNQAFMQLCSTQETGNDLLERTDTKHDSNQDLVEISGNKQKEKECIELKSSESNQQNSVGLTKAIEISDMTVDPCSVLDTGQEKPCILVTEKPTKMMESEIVILEQGSPVNIEGEVGNLMLERSLSNESGDTSLTIEEPTGPCDSVCPLLNIHEPKQCPEGNVFVEFEAGVQLFQQPSLSDTETAVVVEIKDDAVESLDQGSDQVDRWRERMKNEQPISEAGTHSSQTESRRSVVDCLHAVQIQKDTDAFYPPQHCPHTSTQTCTAIPEDNEKLSAVGLKEEGNVSPKTPNEVEDSVFKEPEEPAACIEDTDQKVRVSWSSTDDASSTLGTFSEEASFTSPDPSSSRLSWKSEAEDTGLGEMEGGEENEKTDQLTSNLVSSAILRASQRSQSPSRRHSWEPGRNDAITDTDMEQSGSLKKLSEEVKPAKTYHRRSMSWCPSNLPIPDPKPIDNRSYSLEGLEVEQEAGELPCLGLSEQGDAGIGVCVISPEDEPQKSCHQVLSVTSSCPGMFHHQTLTKSISMVTINHRDVDGTSSCNSGTLEYSISEEEPGPLRSSADVKGAPRISRTFSYLRSKMTKKGKEKEKDKKGEKDRETKDRDRKGSNGHMFAPVPSPASSCCQHCNRLLQARECFLCSNCGVHVHKSCKESVAVCAKNKNKLQVMAPEAAPPTATTRSKSTSSTGSTVSSLSSSSRDRWSTATTPEDQFPSLCHSKRPAGLFNTHTNLSKSISTSNIARIEDVTLKSLKSRSQSTDSLNQNSAVNASTESLTDEGTEMMDSQLMGEFECDMKDLEADSWSSTVDKKFLKTLKKDEIKRQDVIYELYQTEFHHVRTLRIMSEVYYKGIQKELQLDQHTLDKIFPVLDDMLETHTDLLNQLLEQKRVSSVEGQHNNFIILSIGDTLVKQFSGSSAERMKKVYGKFCSRHNESVNHYKDLLVKDKHFQPFIKKVMSSTIVRRLSIPECILLVTQRITKYPVLIQRILQHTKEADADHTCVSEALRLVKEIITAVDCKVNEQEKKQRLKEVYSRTDSKSIMRMKSGQMFAKEDLIRGRRLLHDGALQLKNTAGRLKEVHSLLLSDMLVFLQEKDQKYIFASLDQRSTVISLQNLIVREVANEERGLFLITAGTEKPEMVEVLASSKDERNTWRAIIQDAMNCMEKDEDEGIPSETEDDRRQHESRAKEIRELLRSKDEQIVSLLEEKVHIFRELSDCSAALHNVVRERMLFRATPDDVTKGEPIIQEALREVESLHSLVNTGLGGTGCSVPISPTGGGVGPVCLPRRAETFGGFDSHQMNISKNGEKEEADESVDLRRTESDGVLKKGATASLQLLLKRNNEQVQSSVTHLHDLLLSLQAVVVQQDSFIEDQRQAMNERLTSSRHSSSSSLSSASSSRPSSLIEQEKHRSLERQRQEAASLQKQQAAHLEEKRRREREWEVKDKVLSEREEQLKEEEEQSEKRRQELLEERDLLQKNREHYQRDVERLKEVQTRLERDKEALKRDTERLEAQRREQAEQMYSRTPSITSEDSVRFPSTTSLDLDCRDAAEQAKEVELSSSVPTKEPFLRIGSKRMSKNFNPFASSSSKTQGAEKEPSRLLQLTKSKKDKEKEKKEKKDKKKKKGGEVPPTGTQAAVMSDPQNDGDIFFC